MTDLCESYTTTGGLCKLIASDIRGGGDCDSLPTRSRFCFRIVCVRYILSPTRTVVDLSFPLSSFGLQFSLIWDVHFPSSPFFR